METETMTGCHHGMLEPCTECWDEKELADLKAENARMRPVFDAAVAFVDGKGFAHSLWDAVRNLGE